MTSNEIFHAAVEGKPAPRAPFWIMRQAGRYLPEYRALKEKRGFLEIVKTPELALEASMQPVRRFDFDCAIIFSDILVVAEALGFDYDFRPRGGIALERSIKDVNDIKNLPPAAAVREKLGYVKDALKMLRNELPDKAVLGFCASPFTLAAYMIEGGSSPDFRKFNDFFTNEPYLFEMLSAKLALAISEYAQMQLECGIDALQMFDSQASCAPFMLYEDLSARSANFALSKIQGRVKTIFFANGMAGRFEEVKKVSADAYSLDSLSSLPEIAAQCGNSFALQGNLQNSLLSDSTPEIVAQKTSELLNSMKPYRHILNLGHGILPDAKLENVEALAGAAKNFRK
ncbi:MAG: uroporphyrinogen decarboxylase [Opitutales bacterium]|nr:uroporphyrinogen decarboxylase [Opitutales bacterium]